MKSKRLFIALGNIDDKYIDEDAEESANIKNQSSKRMIYRYAGLAACLIIFIAIFGLPNLFINSVETPPDNSDPPAHEATPSGDIDSPANEIMPWQIGFYGDYQTLVKFAKLLEQGDQDIESEINKMRESFKARSDGYFIGFMICEEHDPKADLKMVANIFQKPFFPVMKGTEPISVEFYYIFDSHYTLHGFPEHFRDDHWQAHLRYEINGIECSFNLSSSQAEDILLECERIGVWGFDLIKEEGDISIYLQKPLFDPDTLLNYDPEVPRFGMDVKGLWINAAVMGTYDIQTAVDNILSFEFTSLISD
jgi:hypothetical protein